MLQAVLATLYIHIVVPIAKIICHLLPPSPFRPYIDNPPAQVMEFIRAINYFCPIERFIIIGGIWLDAMIIWYAVRWIIDLVHNADFVELYAQWKQFFHHKTNGGQTEWF